MVLEGFFDHFPVLGRNLVQDADGEGPGKLVATLQPGAESQKSPGREDCGQFLVGLSLPVPLGP